MKPRRPRVVNKNRQEHNRSLERDVAWGEKKKIRRP